MLNILKQPLVSRKGDDSEVRSANVAQKMSRASSRVAPREEDMNIVLAYSMSICYYIQLDIIGKRNEESAFAWRRAELRPGKRW